MVKLKKGHSADPASKFDGFGVDFKCKLIGSCDVSVPRGDDVCQEAISKLKQHALKMNKEKKEHKQRITVNITFKGIRLLDEQTERIEYGHPIQRISFISHDKDDKRTFGYIVGTKEGYKLFAIRTPKEAELITKTLKELFQAVFDRHQDKKNEGSIASVEIAQEVEEKEEESPVIEEDTEGELLNWDTLNEQIEVMHKHGGMTRADSTDMLADVRFAADSQNPFGDDTFDPNTRQQNHDIFSSPPDPVSEIDFFGVNSLTTGEEQLAESNSTSTSNDLYALLSAPPPAAPSVVEEQSADTPLLISDPFAELKKNINEIHKQQNINYQQPSYPYTPQQNAFPPQQQHRGSIPCMQPAAANNPFIGANPISAAVSQPPLVVPSNPFMQSTSVPPPSNTGWTVTKPSPAPRADVRKTQMGAGSDPFAFLDNQTGTKQVTNNNIAVKIVNPNDPFNLLG